MQQVREQIDSVYERSDYVGSLVTGGDTGRVTEYDGPKVQPSDWWQKFWQRYESAYKVDRKTAHGRLVKLMGENYKRRPVTDLYLRDILSQ